MLPYDIAAPDTLDAKRGQLFDKPQPDLAAAPNCDE